jgi:hypothetical protein
MVATLVLIHVVARAGTLPLDDALGRFASGVGLAIRPGGTPSIFAVLLYCAGIVGADGGYAWLALTTTGITRDDVVAVWSLLDKRQLVFAYLVIAAFVLFHRAMVCLFFAPTYGWRETHAAPRRSWLARGCRRCRGCRRRGWAPRPCATSFRRRATSKFTAITRSCTSGTEQIRLGAVPYVEAQTQYGSQPVCLCPRLCLVSATTASMLLSC